MGECISSWCLTWWKLKIIYRKLKEIVNSDRIKEWSIAD